MKVNMMEANSITSLEALINLFMLGRNILVKDIKYQAVGNPGLGSIKYSAMVIYYDEKELEAEKER